MKKKYKITSKKFKNKAKQLAHFTGRKLETCEVALMYNFQNLKRSSKWIKNY